MGLGSPIRSSSSFPSLTSCSLMLSLFVINTTPPHLPPDAPHWVAQHSRPANERTREVDRV